MFDLLKALKNIIMFNGKKKALTFSYDDGVTQNIRLIDIFNKYNHKATFNLNSERWEQIEAFCKMVSNNDDIFCGTNKEALIY